MRSLRAVGSLDARGPIPVLFDEPFDLDQPAELAAAFDELLELSRHTQVLYLTANPDLLAWAKALPERSGSLVVPSAPAPSATLRRAESPSTPDPEESDR